MDQFSHDLTLALEETSLMDRARVSRWGQRRRTRSTGNLPCAPQPTEDSSSSPTDAGHPAQLKTNIDGLDPRLALPSDSDDKEEMRLQCKPLNVTARLGALESDSLNETTFSPARFFKPNTRRKRKMKRMSMEYDLVGTAQTEYTVSFPTTAASSSNSMVVAEGSLACVGISANANATRASLTANAAATGTIRKRLLKPEANNRSNLFFSGKRKRSNRDRYNEHEHGKASSSVPRHTYMEEYCMRPRSYSSTHTKPRSERLLPLNKGLLSKIEKISQTQQKTDEATLGEGEEEANELASAYIAATPATIVETSAAAEMEEIGNLITQQQQTLKSSTRKKSGRRSRRLTMQQQLQFAVDQPMDCGELNDFLSSSSLSSSESDDVNTANDTDREGDDELTDWPGNENVCGSSVGDNKFDPKRKLTKKSNLPILKSAEETVAAAAAAIMLTGTEDDTLMSGSEDWSPFNDTSPHETRYQPQISEPITITGRSFALGRSPNEAAHDDMHIPLKQIESEMSGETSNPFLASPPCQPAEVREIRAGCRRVKGERPGFSIKTSVNERLARFLQDPRQMKIRLPDIEIYEHESLINLASLYSLQMCLDNGCAVLTKTSNTTQSVNIDQQSLQSRLLLSDFKRRCYEDDKVSFMPGE